MEILGRPPLWRSGRRGITWAGHIYNCVRLSTRHVDRAFPRAALLDRRRPGSNKLGTPRREDDKVIFLSGLCSDDHERLLAGPKLSLEMGDLSLQTQAYEAGYSTGEPIAAIVLSAAKRSADYEQFSGQQGEVRPEPH